MLVCVFDTLIWIFLFYYYYPHLNWPLPGALHFSFAWSSKILFIYFARLPVLCAEAGLCNIVCTKFNGGVLIQLETKMNCHTNMIHFKTVNPLSYSAGCCSVSQLLQHAYDLFSFILLLWQVMVYLPWLLWIKEILWSNTEGNW